MVGERNIDSAGTGPAGAPRRRVRYHGALPRPRALTGAALVVLAAAGVLVAHRTASEPPTTRYVVAARSIAAGHVLTGEDLGTMAAELPSGMAAVAASDATDLVGRVTRTSMSELDLVRPDDVLARGRFTVPGSVEVPVEVDAARALDGIVRSGSRVDVLSTDPDGQGTVALARDVLVVGVDAPSGDAIGDSSARRVRLAAPDATAASAIVDASVRSQLTLVLPTPVEGPGRG
jgi:Flp pilus assembly protein CpaB